MSSQEPDAVTSPSTPQGQAWVSRRWMIVTIAMMVISAVMIAVLLVMGEERVTGTSAEDRAAAEVPTATATPDPTVTPTPTPLVLAPPPQWSAGMAAEFACNLVTAAGFDQEELPANWYHGDPANSVTALAGTGIDNSTALRIGAGAAYGLFAQQVPVTGGEVYHFSAWVRRQGDPFRSGMWVEFETASYDLIDGADESVFEPADGLLNRDWRRITRTFEAPADAAWALPTFFKDASTGSLLIDEVVFGPASECAEVPR